MIYKVADNILSPLGETTEQNYQSVVSGRSALTSYSGKWGLPEPFCASLLSETQNQSIACSGLSHYESMALFSIRQAVSQTDIDLSSPRVVLIFSTTKGNVEKLMDSNVRVEATFLGASAKKIASVLGVTTTPITVCNACISGVSALILAYRLLGSEKYEHAIVCGADSQNRFTVSGFQSLKAMSAEACKPFDIERIGLNLGEAAATMILTKSSLPLENRWEIVDGAARNDAYHISAPSKNGEGAYLALKAVTENIAINDIALINAHGTATMFNDQMESVAVERAGLSDVPVNAYKGYFGHTMGAAGVLETVLSMKALDEGKILGTKGYAERGVSGNLRLTPDNQSSEKKMFVKMISGFGGSNAAILLSKGHCPKVTHTGSSASVMTHSVTITPSCVKVDGRELPVEEVGASRITEIYKRYITDYPKFYKMDMLCRLGFVASELLLKLEKEENDSNHGNRGVILFNRSSSVLSDIKYIDSIKDKDDFFPSPSIFVYTLPNIVTGEIALRNHYNGETSLYILDERNEEMMNSIISASFLDLSTESILTGWLDYLDEENYVADLKIIES